jgi:Zn-dependent protease with chaperone function
MRASFLGCLLLLLSFSFPTIANDEIKRALAALGTGTATELKARLITDHITVFDDRARANAIAALPAAMRDRRVTQGRLLRRIEPLLAQVLQLHERLRASQQPELFLFTHDTPTAMLWRGCVLLVSTGLAEPLYDGELVGIFAHELGHAYFEDEMAAAHQQSNTQARRVVELKCDGVAILSVKLLGHNPTLYLQGLQRIQAIYKRLRLASSILQSHPELVARVQFAERLIKSLG